MVEKWSGPDTFNRNGAWAFYVLMNLLAIYFNTSLMISVYRLKDKKTSTDVLIAGFASGIVIAAFGCGPQCLFNMVMQEFAFGESACFFEAFFHIVGMIIQFLSVSSIAYRTYVGVVKLQSFGIVTAYGFVIAIWCLAFAGTLLFGSYSKIYLVASGTFCFYEWSSLALIAWAWPVAGIAAALMGFWYYQTFKTVAIVRKGARDILLDGSKKNAELVIKLSVLVLFFVFGYSGLVAQSLYEVTIGRAKIWGDVIAAVICLFYWVSAPFAYSMANHRLGLASVLIGTPNERWSQRSDTKLHSGKKIASTSAAAPASNGETEMSNVSKREIGSQVASPIDSPLRGTSRLEGSPENSAGGLFAFDDEKFNTLKLNPTVRHTTTTAMYHSSSLGSSSLGSFPQDRISPTPPWTNQIETDGQTPRNLSPEVPVTPASSTTHLLPSNYHYDSQQSPITDLTQHRGFTFGSPEDAPSPSLQIFNPFFSAIPQQDPNSESPNSTLVVPDECTTIITNDMNDEENSGTPPDENGTLV